MATSGQLQQTRPPSWAHFCAGAKMWPTGRAPSGTILSSVSSLSATVCWTQLSGFRSYHYSELATPSLRYLPAELGLSGA